jgi:hypothetical protein
MNASSLSEVSQEMRSAPRVAVIHASAKANYLSKFKGDNQHVPSKY